MKHLKHKGILLVLIGYYFITIYVLTKDALSYRNIINPLFWGCLLGYFLYNRKKWYLHFSTNRKYLIRMIMISSVHVVVYFYFGFIMGFSKSPYQHDIVSILKNMLIQLLPIFSIEITRAVLILKNKKNKWLLGIVPILLILLEIDYHTILSLFSNKEELFQYSCSTILPLIACHILCTYLVLKGSYSLPFIYRIFKEIAILLLPILPDMNWFVSGSFYLLLPEAVYVLYQYRFIRQRKKPKSIKSSYTKISYIIVLFLCGIFICFMLGFFPYQPIAILSNSMNPTFFRGDMLIFKTVKEEELKQIEPNTIIVYQIGEQNIAHRIIKRIEEKHSTLYQTKGDNNNVADRNLVKIDQIQGVYVFHIKYIGFPSVWLYHYFHTEDAKVET